MKSCSTSSTFVRKAAVAAVALGIAVGGFNTSEVAAQEPGPWTVVPGGPNGAPGASWNSYPSQMIPIPDLSDCDACDLSGVPVYGERRKPYLGDRIHDWWGEHVRAKRRSCYYHQQEFHRSFFNPVLYPSGAPYGFHAKTWSPFPECYSPVPSGVHGGVY